jgi:hypothetical protein
VLGDARYPVAIAAALAGAAAGFAAAREAFAAIVRAAPGKRWIIAVAVALAANGAAIGGELYVRHDAAYRAMMMSERDRTIGRELGHFRSGRPEASADELDAERRRLEGEHPAPFPFAPVFGAITLAAIVLGCRASLRRPGEPQAVSGRIAARAAIIAAAGMALVVAIQLVFGS